jgi:hypothetical protein
MDIEKPSEKGTLIVSKIKLLPLAPYGPHRVKGFLIAHTAEGPEVVGDMTLECDDLAMLEFALIEFRKGVSNSLKQIAEEIKAAKVGKVIEQVSTETVRRFTGKG